MHRNIPCLFLVFWRISIVNFLQGKKNNININILVRISCEYCALFGVDVHDFWCGRT